ncbi:putative membrane protein [Neolecta irregularis DAH-3]|uniref:Putative membrane protein n=1 Tax=Neolecta irregularis (strain DAH-3) TaxID=1198029 RepID=A0A1U7LML2_NEOID|nr:putative membrane protein [Neolecta irregularis DAH-3]|eukprot:OLL23823.1 putative membrane protein [Neolecta irregularis DAH-3]
MTKTPGSSSPLLRTACEKIKRHSMSELAIPSGIFSQSSSRSPLSFSLDRSPLPFASEKRNKEFHRIFKSIAGEDRLIEDYSCALQKEILVQGRMYIAASQVCFNSRILGFHTSLVIDIADIRSIEKKTTAMIFHNGIVITTRHRRYTFASLVSRDNAFNLILDLWQRVPRQEYSSSDAGSIDSASLSFSEDEPDHSQSRKSSNTSDTTQFIDTTCECADSHYTKIAVDEIVNHPLTHVCDHLILNSRFMTGFISSERNSDICIAQWSNSTPQIREITYMKPLNVGPIGPKQTRVITTETLHHLDTANYITMLATTTTPDVPSGTSFSTKTRTCLTHARSATRIVITVAVEWSKTSWLKGPIEKSALDGVTGYSKNLVDKLIEFLDENGKSRNHEIQHQLTSLAPEIIVSETNTSALAKRRSDRRLLSNYPSWLGWVPSYFSDSLLDFANEMCSIQGFTCVLLVIVIIRLLSLESAIRELHSSIPHTSSFPLKEWISERLEAPLLQSLADLSVKRSSE